MFNATGSNGGNADQNARARAQRAVAADARPPIPGLRVAESGQASAWTLRAINNVISSELPPRRGQSSVPITLVLLLGVFAGALIEAGDIRLLAGDLGGRRHLAARDPQPLVASGSTTSSVVLLVGYWR